MPDSSLLNLISFLSIESTWFPIHLKKLTLCRTIKNQDSLHQKSVFHSLFCICLSFFIFSECFCFCFLLSFLFKPIPCHGSLSNPLKLLEKFRYSVFKGYRKKPVVESESMNALSIGGLIIMKQKMQNQQNVFSKTYMRRLMYSSHMFVSRECFFMTVSHNSCALFTLWRYFAYI